MYNNRGWVHLGQIWGNIVHCTPITPKKCHFSTMHITQGDVLTRDTGKMVLFKKLPWIICRDFIVPIYNSKLVGILKRIKKSSDEELILIYITCVCLNDWFIHKWLKSHANVWLVAKTLKIIRFSPLFTTL